MAHARLKSKIMKTETNISSNQHQPASSDHQSIHPPIHESTTPPHQPSITPLDVEPWPHPVDGKSLLHNSMVIYGSGNADGNRHTHVNLPVILAGSGGGALKPGRFVKAGGVPMTNLFIEMVDRFGLKAPERFGDSTGRFSQI